jgi:hypothetical protein
MPSNYDDGGIVMRIDPTTLYQYATSDIPNHAKEIAGHVSNIVNVMNNMTNTEWVGPSSSAAQDFNTKWAKAVNDLFGSNSDPSSGVLPKIGAAVAMAAANYGGAEDTITTNLKDFIAGLNTPSGGPDAVGTPPGRGQTVGPVTQTAPLPPAAPSPSPATGTSGTSAGGQAGQVS